MRFMDMYAGIGGATEGARKAGLEPVFAFESDVPSKTVYGTNQGIDPKDDPGIIDPKQVPYCDVMFAAPPGKTAPIGMLKLCLIIRPRIVVLEYRHGSEPRGEDIAKWLDTVGYSRRWSETISADECGLPHSTKYFYTIAIRSDVIVRFQNSFPFPDPLPRIALSSILEENPSDELYVVNNGKWNHPKPHSPGDIVHTVPLGLYKDPHAITVECEKGVRRLSLTEIKLLMGFPASWRMPLPTTTSMRLLCKATCPPTAGAVLGEVVTWFDTRYF